MIRSQSSVFLNKMSKGFYDFSVTTIKGDILPMSSLKGKLVLVVNVASRCGFTPQYMGLVSFVINFSKNYIKSTKGN